MHTPSEDLKARFGHLPTYENDPLLFKGARFSVRNPTVPGKDGRTLKRDVVVHPGAVTILPFLDKETVVLIRNQRYAVGEELWELPAGTLEPGEEPLETAKREIIEETGYQADKVEALMSFYTTPGFCNEVMYAYLATDLQYVGQSLDDSEQIIVEKVKWTETLKMVRDGTIIDGKTITIILFYNQFFRL